MSVNLLLIFFVLIVVAMIAFILVQKGSGATAGSAFGSGASSTVFGAKGSGNFLTKTTMILAFLFFAISMLMAISASRQFTAAVTGEVDLGVMGSLDTSSETDVPTMINNAGSDNQTDVPELNELDVDVDASSVNTSTNAVVNEEASSIKEAMEGKVEEVKSDVEDQIGEIKTGAEGQLDEAKSTLGNTMDAVKDKVEEVKDTIEDNG